MRSQTKWCVKLEGSQDTVLSWEAFDMTQNGWSGEGCLCYYDMKRTRTSEGGSCCTDHFHSPLVLMSGRYKLWNTEDLSYFKLSKCLQTILSDLTWSPFWIWAAASFQPMWVLLGARPESSGVQVWGSALGIKAVRMCYEGCHWGPDFCARSIPLLQWQMWRDPLGSCRCVQSFLSVKWACLNAPQGKSSATGLQQCCLKHTQMSINSLHMS